jgi:hypothetical protein
VTLFCTSSSRNKTVVCRDASDPNARGNRWYRFVRVIPISRSGTWREYRASPSGGISVYDCRVEYDYSVNRVVDKCTLVEQKKSVFLDYLIMIEGSKDNLTLIVTRL